MKKMTFSDEKINVYLQKSLEHFASKIPAGESKELTQQYSDLRKLVKFTEKFLKITYNGYTEQRKEALSNIRSTIRDALECYSDGQKSEIEAYTMVKDTELTNRTEIEKNYAEKSWWKFTVGRVTGSASRTATQLQEAAESAENEPLSPMLGRN